MAAKPVVTAPPEPARPADGIVARLRQRLFKPAVLRLDKPSAPLRHNVGFHSGLAELLLINRLRARLKAAPSADVLERAARIIFITCKNWFSDTRPSGSTPRTRL